MRTIKIPPGSSIQDAIGQALALAEPESPVRFDFNRHEVIVRHGEDPRDVYKRFHDDVERARLAWEASDEGKAYHERQLQKLMDAQRDAQAAARLFDSVNLGDVDEVMRWISVAQECSDFIGSGFKARKFAGALIAAGYRANEGVGEDLSDRNKMARYVIGQAVAGMSSPGAIHHIVKMWCDDLLAGRMPPQRGAR